MSSVIPQNKDVLTQDRLPMKRSVFFISDRTGITAEMLSNTLLSQFEQVHFEKYSLPFVDNMDKAHAAVEKINAVATQDGIPPLLFKTLIDDEIRAIINSSRGVSFDFFDTFIKPLEHELGIQSNHAIGRSHGQGQYNNYKARIDAVNFALHNDDGSTLRNLAAADIILVGVSRTGKTPACLYMALHYGVLAANYPVTDEELDSEKLPAALQPYRNKLFGLSIDPVRLQQIRTERRPDSAYANLKQCQYEVRNIENMFRLEKIPFLNTSTMSIEEICSSIMHQSGLKRRCSL